MDCSLCRSADSRPEANFCEECGAPLRPSVPTSMTLPAPSPRDHIELTLDGPGAAVSDRGLRHAHNEDSIALQRLPDGRLALVVCDGVSHSHRPADASAAGTEATVAALQAGGDLAKALSAAEDAVRAVAAGEAIPAQLDPPESTIVAAQIRGRQIELAWLGDSRAYFIGETGSAQLLTRDHSWINQEIEAGRLTEAEARTRREAGSVVRTLGGPAAAPGQLLDPPSFASHTAAGSGWLLLCSDGWWIYQPDAALLARIFRAALRDTARATDPPLALARLLVETGRRAGGRDNISVALLRLS